MIIQPLWDLSVINNVNIQLIYSIYSIVSATFYFFSHNLLQVKNTWRNKAQKLLCYNHNFILICTFLEYSTGVNTAGNEMLLLHNMFHIACIFYLNTLPTEGISISWRVGGIFYKQL